MFCAMIVRAWPARVAGSSRRTASPIAARTSGGRSVEVLRDELDHAVEEGRKHMEQYNRGTVTKFRVERDPLGEVRVPADAYYGAQTQRALDNFPISGLTAPPALVVATAQIKKAAAAANGAAPPASVENRQRYRRGGGRSSRRPAPRTIRRRHLPGRRRHVAQHERERGAGEPGGGDARRRPRRVHAGPPERSREHGPVDERRVPDGDARCPHCRRRRRWSRQRAPLPMRSTKKRRRSRRF